MLAEYPLRNKLLDGVLLNIEGKTARERRLQKLVGFIKPNKYIGASMGRRTKINKTKQLFNKQGIRG